LASNIKNYKYKIKKIIIFYNNYRGLILKDFLKKRNYEVFSIITKKYLNPEIIENSKKENNIILINSLKSKKTYNFLKFYNADIFISAGFPHIFSKKFLKLPKFGIINLHAGKLPKYRGGSPLNWQIIKNEKNIGISIIKLNKGIDTGNIICTDSFKNIKNDTIKEVHRKANDAFKKLTIKALKFISINKKLYKQKLSRSYFFQRTEKDSRIDWNQDALSIYNFVRALSDPYKGAFTLIKNKKYRIYKCKEVNINPDIKPGKIFKKTGKKEIFIRCKKNSIKLINSDLFNKNIKYLNYETLE
tara:strand:+ start:4512 stop:5417 length:906 start_codon:yes stop_codon:yes gene_type:complete